MRAVERLPWWLGGAFAVSLGVVGVAHTPLGASLRSWLAPICPVDPSHASPSTLEHARVDGLAVRKGDVSARMRPALGFELGASTRADVQAELSRREASCESERADTALRCSFAGRHGAPESLLAVFSGDKLVALDVLRAVSNGARALSWLQGLERELSARVGEATARIGTRDAEELGSARFAQSIVEYRYLDYVAQISALNTGSAIKLREQYQYLPGS